MTTSILQENRSFRCGRFLLSRVAILAGILFGFGLAAGKAQTQESSSELSPPTATETQISTSPETDGGKASPIRKRLEEVWAKKQLEPAATIDDRSFLRRVYLDLVGRVPLEQESAEFIGDQSSDRRAKLVDKLLQSDEHAKHFAELFDVLLMGRPKRGEARSRRENGWYDYLELSIRENRPWNQIAKELVLARPIEDKYRGAVVFIYERENKHQEIAEAVSANLFGVQIQCAQCHDHPLADEIRQKHYWGLVGFFRRSENVQSKNGIRVGESAIGGYENFSDLSGNAQPNLLVFFNDQQVQEERPADPKTEKDDDLRYRASEREGDPRVPLNSRRQKFADEIVAKSPFIAKAFTNKIWNLLLGRGLVHPFDKIDSTHRPSHPELFDELTNDFVQSGYDMRKLVREIVLCDAYALESRNEKADADPADFATFLNRPITAEVYARSLATVVYSEPNRYREILPSLAKEFPDVLPETSVTSLGQAMYLTNNEQLHQFLFPKDQKTPLQAKLEASDNDAAIQYLFKRMFEREPTQEELNSCQNFLQSTADRSSQLQELTWALATSAEFRFQH